MGEALLGSAMEMVLERLQGRDLNELLKKLKIALLSVNSVVDDAEKKQYHNQAVKMWLDDFKDAFYHVEDLMDDILTEDLQQSLDHWQRISKTDIERKTGEVLMKMEFVAKQKDVLGLRETIVGYDMKSSLSIPTTPFVRPDRVFGRDPDVEEMRDVFNVLRQSYVHLPAHLKRCFEYCSIFPKGYEFEKEKLILLWMAEGLLQQPRGNHRMEDLGEEYFHELLSMSLFQPSSGNKSRFRMRDLISDLAIYVSGKFSFRLENDDPAGLTASVRYLSLFRCKYNSPEIFEGIRKARYVRTFLALDHECHLSSNELPKLLFKLQFLRVLSLFCYRIDELPDSIGNLKHLRYIDLSYAAIKRLPQSVCALRNLQSLILFYCCSLTELPENIWQLSNLRHLDITGTALKEIPREICELKNLQKLILANCHSLTELPEGMWQLSNLSHLDITGTALKEIPREICELKIFKS